MTLAVLGGVPVRSAFPEPRPRLSAVEVEQLREVLLAAEWSRAADDWPVPVLDALERQWAERHAVREAVAVSSGTAALTLVLRALRLPPGDEVLIPAYGCPAVDVAVLAAGLTPIHVDIDPRTYALSLSATAAAITPRAAALVAVHFAGQPAPLPQLGRMAERYGLALIEDACLAPGAAYEGRPVGGWGKAGIFSLGIRKPISAGEGGVAVTNDPELAAEVRRLRSLGANADTGAIVRPGGNFRLTALQAAAALPQLNRIDADLERRRDAADRVAAALEGSPYFSLLERLPGVTRHGWAQVWIRYNEDAAEVPRARVARAVQAEGIPLFSGWEHPNYCHAFYTADRAVGWLSPHAGREATHYEGAHCPHAERASFSEALLLDFPLLDGGEAVIADTAEALRRVGDHLSLLRQD